MASLAVKALSIVVKPLLKKFNKREIASKLLKTGNYNRSTFFKGKSDRFAGTFHDAYKLAGGKVKLGKESGAMGGTWRVDPITGKLKRFHSDVTKGKLREATLASPKSLANLKLSQIPSTDPTLTEGGIEGLIRASLAGEKSSLGTALSADKSSVKGILSMARAAILRNPKKREKILRAANLKKYNEEIQPYLTQLDDVERQIRYWLSEGDAKDVAKIKQLMTRYAELKKSVDPRYWHARGMTWGHPAGLMANIKNVKAKGLGADFSDYLTSHPKSLTRYDPEIGPLNIGKDPIDMTVMESIRDPNIPVTRKGLDKISDIYEGAGVRSIMPSLTGKRMILGKHDLIKQIDYLMKALRQNRGPFEGLNKKELQKLLTGYKAGGLVGLGSRILRKLSKKLSRQEMKMMGQ